MDRYITAEPQRIGNTQVGWTIVEKQSGLIRSKNRDSKIVDKLKEALYEGTGKVHSQVGFDVSCKRPAPMILTLPRRPRGSVPRPLRQPVTETGEDDMDRGVVSGPVAQGANGINTSAIVAAPLSKWNRLIAFVEISLYEAMAPNPGTPASFAKTSLWTRELIISSEP